MDIKWEMKTPINIGAAQPIEPCPGVILIIWFLQERLGEQEAEQLMDSENHNDGQIKHVQSG